MRRPHHTQDPENFTVTKETARMTALTRIPSSLEVRTPRWAVLCLTLFALLIPAANAAAQGEVKWRVDPLASTTTAPGSTFEYRVQVTNAGSTAANAAAGPITFSIALPAGLTVSSVTPLFGGGWDCSSVIPGSSSAVCAKGEGEMARWTPTTFIVDLAVAPAAAGTLTATFSVSGGEASDPTATATDPTTIAPGPMPFGIDAFDSRATAGAAEAPFTQAAGHPDATTTSIDFNTYTNPQPYKGTAWPVAPTKDVLVDLPPGFLGNPTTLAQCTLADLANAHGTQVLPLCPVDSQVGVATIRSLVGTFIFQGLRTVLGPLALYNMVPPPGAPARFAFNAGGTIVIFDAHLRSSGDYGLSVDADNIPEGVDAAGSEVTFWGVPAASSHDLERSCPGGDNPSAGPSAPSCKSPASLVPFLRQPTACTASGEGLSSTARADSWFEPGAFTAPKLSSSPLDTEGCAAVPFNPGLSAQPTTNAADSPSGLDLHLTVPQDCWTQPGSICQSDLRDAEVKLPAGMTLNPSAASGLAACTPAQVGLTTPTGSSPIHFGEAPANCPDGSKIGKVDIKTPLLEEELHGGVYLAKQNDNPFNSLLAMYLVAENAQRGVIVKQAGRIDVGPGGRLTTVFSDAPQQPFTALHVSLFGGPRAALRTPPACGEFASQAKLTPWSGGPAANLASVFDITNCPNSGFDPKLSAGTQNPLAGSYSPFSLRLTREDGTQELAALDETLPAGLAARLAGIPYCPDSALAAVSGAEGTGASQEAHPSCPAASQVGTVTVGAGAGPNPFYTSSGRAYLAGPYKGAPLSIAVITPAVAGPLDLGSVVVRNALYVDPATAQGTVKSDPIPTALHGIPLDLRDVRVQLSRSGFTLNPTSCEPKSVDATATSAQGAVARPSARFQAAGCDRLGFKPKLALKLSGGTKRGAHPALKATLTMPCRRRQHRPGHRPPCPTASSSTSPTSAPSAPASSSPPISVRPPRSTVTPGRSRRSSNSRSKGRSTCAPPPTSCPTSSWPCAARSRSTPRQGLTASTAASAPASNRCPTPPSPRSCSRWPAARRGCCRTAPTSVRAPTAPRRNSPPRTPGSQISNPRSRPPAPARRARPRAGATAADFSHPEARLK